MGVSYYRIKQIDTDGKFAFSKTAQIAVGGANASWNILPNPVKNVANIRFYSADTNVRIAITDAAGRIVFSQNKNAVNDNDVIAVQMSGFAKGVYFVRITTDNRNDVDKIVVE